MKTTTLRLPEALREELESEAEERDVSFAEHVRQILRARNDLDLDTPNASPNALRNTIDDLEARVSELEERLARRDRVGRDEDVQTFE